MTATRRATRSTVAHGDRGVVSAGSPEAVEVALAVLDRGGNAVDAAVAATAAQCVTETPWCGLGGDLFMLVDHPERGVAAVNGSGAAPHARPESGPARLPRFGPLSVAVPGLVATQQFVLDEYGTRSYAELLAPAVALAEEGFVLDERLASVLATFAGTETDIDAVLGSTPIEAGATFCQPDLARSLTSIAKEGTDWFYRGEFADALEAHMTARGGLLTGADLAGHQVEWTEPLHLRYRGYDVYQHPPVSLGLLMLAELRLFEQFDPAALDASGTDLTETMVRCKVAAFRELRDAVRQERADVEHRLAGVAARWTPRRLAGIDGADVQPGVEVAGGTDTTSLAVRDGAGMTVTAIHSLFNTFGSREVVTGTGVVLNDRLASLRLDGGPGPQFVPGRRPAHTLNAFVAKRAGRTVIAGATPGGRGQVQTNFQVLVNVLDLGLDPGDALDRPRWLHGTPRQPVDDNVLHVENHHSDACVDGLRRSGFDVSVTEPVDDDLFGSVTAVGTAGPSSGRSGDTNYAVADYRRGAASGAL